MHLLWKDCFRCFLNIHQINWCQSTMSGCRYYFCYKGEVTGTRCGLGSAHVWSTRKPWQPCSPLSSALHSVGGHLEGGGGSGAARTECRTVDGLKQKCILPRFWGLDAWGQGVGRAGSFRAVREEAAPGFLPALVVGWRPLVFSPPVEAPPELCLCCHMLFFTCACLPPNFPSIRTLVTLD